ncbi:methyltransferase [Nocardia sp. NPDC005978]|uniref:methyltransferase n=1 Tax=Nocardia sp. NPDC005978 TaxID=3156725 RepID=UPI0033A851EE
MSAHDLDTLVHRLRTAGCVFAEDEAVLLLAAASDPAHLETLVAQRVAGSPLEHLLGWAEFRGLRVVVGPHVFVPRQRTAFLVEQAVALTLDLVERRTRETAAEPSQLTERDWAAMQRKMSRGAAPIHSDDDTLPTLCRFEEATYANPVVVDMCCGSGALGLSLAVDLAAHGVRAELTATDIEPHAVEYARRNLATHDFPVYRGDLFEPLPADLAGRVDILLANTPYVPSAEIATMPPEARDHEPRVTLDGGPDGLDLLRRIAAAAPHWLAPGGHLLVEESDAQADPAAAIMRAAGLSARVAEDEERGATVVIGTRPD